MLIMLASCKVASEVVLVFTLTPTNVTLERVFKSVASHVDGVKDIVRKVHVTVRAVVQELRVLHWQGRGWSAGLAVADAGRAGVGTALAAGPGHGAVVPLIVAGPGVRAGGRRVLRNSCCHSWNHCGCSRLLDHERLFVLTGNNVRGGWILVFGWQAGQLSC